MSKNVQSLGNKNFVAWKLHSIKFRFFSSRKITHKFTSIHSSIFSEKTHEWFYSETKYSFLHFIIILFCGLQFKSHCSSQNRSELFSRPTNFFVWQIEFQSENCCRKQNNNFINHQRLAVLCNGKGKWINIFKWW